MILTKSDIRLSNNQGFYTVNPQINHIVYMNYNHIVRGKIFDNIWNPVRIRIYDQVWDSVKTYYDII
jgi:hypothetical protein